PRVPLSLPGGPADHRRGAGRPALDGTALGRSGSPQGRADPARTSGDALNAVRPPFGGAAPIDGSAPPARGARAVDPRRNGVRPYVALARPDHWFKNVFMALGMLLAVFYEPPLLRQQTIVSILWAVAATCIIASSNYV